MKKMYEVYKIIRLLIISELLNVMAWYYVRPRSNFYRARTEYAMVSNVLYEWRGRTGDRKRRVAVAKCRALDFNSSSQTS